ncbi:MAG: (2Fe-2S)-binding protein [Pseudomonadota bacterium]|nr:(2Fe-2S)-binding protein [Pseudomonadota bacterium]
MSPRVEHEVARGEPFDIEIDGQPIKAYPGETVAAILTVNRIALARTDAAHPITRGYYCGMGVCWECAVRINGRSVVRACMEPAVKGLKVETCLDVGDL